MYNVQPWRFRLVGGLIEVHTDPTRTLPTTDPDGWAARIACGAAVANLRLALGVAGVRARLRIRPAPGDSTLVATVAADGRHLSTPRERALHEAIAHRHSNRRPFADTPVPLDARARLRDAAEAARGWLVFADDRLRVARIADIIRDADKQLRSDPHYEAEMRGWIGRDAADRTGIPLGAGGVAPGGQDLLAMRDYAGTPRADGRDFESDPLLAVLGTFGHTPDQDVIAGMLLQGVLLTATTERLATSMLSQPMEVPALRDELVRALHRHGTAQMVVRIGYGHPVAASMRRPVDAVIDIDD